MKQDLIFHLVSKRKWKQWQNDGYFRPEPQEMKEIGVQPDWIRCLTGDQVEQYANQNYSNRKNILMLVIHIKRLTGKVEYRQLDDGKEYAMVEGRINLDAIIDKIRLMPDENGKFEIHVEQA